MEPNQRPRRRLVVIDGANSVYRAFFAIPNLRAPDGTPTGAVYGFASMLAKVLREERPDLVAVAFDPRGGSFRRRIDASYKAGRDAQPEDLSAQLPLVNELIDAFGIQRLEVEDFEADDVIATLVAEAPEDVDVSIISTDKDLMQLVDERVELVDSVKDLRYGPRQVEERFGVPPEGMLDLRALVGDSSDNIPGVKGIGEKGAAQLLRQWGSLEELLDHAADVPAKRAREALLAQRDQALLSKRLSSLRADVPLSVALQDLAPREPDLERLRGLYQKLGFSRLLTSLGAGPAPAASAEAGPEVEVCLGPDTLAKALARASRQPPVALELVAGDGSAVEARPVGLAVACDDGSAVYAPLRAEGLAAQTGLTEAALLAVLSEHWPSSPDASAPSWIGAHTKSLQSILGERGLELPPPAADLEVASFLLDPAGAHGVEPLARVLLGRELATWEEVAGRGAKAVAAGGLPVEAVAGWAAARVCAVRALYAPVRERLEADGLLPLFEQIEVPLTAVLSRIERAGVRIDEAKLADLSRQYEVQLARLEEEIYELAGRRFLIGSPKQLQEVLFDELKLSPLKKTKTGYSTAENVLDQLASQHPLPARILDYRRLAKLKSTYVDALPPLVCTRSGRIHPHFNQLGAATGRLSASSPNVQNIPIRGDEGVRIREAFVPAEGRLLLSADYSQVELRILAHYSKDESLIEAFRKGEDIHRRTAAEVAGIALSEVSEEQRARAKAVNFGIIYGSSAFGLANQLGIASSEAQETIDAYFRRYRGVRRFLDETIERAREVGYVATLLGRRRYLPDLSSRNRVLRQAAERMAVNSVIQGTAADLIKKAMVEVDGALRRSGMRVDMILQVHDELVFELSERDVPTARELVRGCMEGALTLRVPLVTDIGVGRSWREAH